MDARLMKNRLGEEHVSNQGCLMKIIKYNNANNIVVEFQDKYKAKVFSAYKEFSKGNIKNPYHPSVCGVGMIGIKYPAKVNGCNTREYNTWQNMIHRCYDKKIENRQPTYKDINCCDEWLLFENFYEWLHEQDNFDKWLSGERWAIDKDILFKRNKIYSPDTCCLIPQNVNCLFTKRENYRGNLPIGVTEKDGGYQVRCMNPFTNKFEYLGFYTTPEKAFLVYKIYKEKIIKQVAEFEYSKGNITEQCYQAMMNYEVEITD